MTRDDILDAAAQVFREKGFHGASMEDVASAVNLRKASLYHHVTSKQEMLLALLERALGVLTEHIARVANQDMAADQKLKLMMRAYLMTLSENADLSSVLLFEHRSLDKKSHARHVPQRDKFEALWREVFYQGVSEGLFQCPDVGLAVRGLMGMMNWAITWYRPGGAKTMERIADEYAELILNGLLKKR